MDEEQPAGKIDLHVEFEPAVFNMLECLGFWPEPKPERDAEGAPAAEDQAEAAIGDQNSKAELEGSETLGQERLKRPGAQALMASKDASVDLPRPSLLLTRALEMDRYGGLIRLDGKSE